MATQSDVELWLNKIQTAVYGEEVRTSIWKAIDACYKDVHKRELIRDGIDEVLRQLIAEGVLSDEIFETIGLLTETTENLFDFTKVVPGRVRTEVSPANGGGEINTSGSYAIDYRTSDFIPISAGTVYYISNTVDRCYYSTSKVYDKTIKPGANGWTALSDGYIRVVVKLDNLNKAGVYANTNRSTYIPGRTAVDAALRDKVYTKDVTDSKYVPCPSPNDLGQSGQILRSTGTGTEWVTPASPTSAQVDTAVQAWLNNHPEATTTVEDGAVTTAKLASESVTADKMADDSVTSDAIADDAVITGGIADGAVTKPKLSEDVKDVLARIESSSDITVVPSFDEASETTTEYVLVENDGVHGDGFMGSGGACLYRHWQGWGDRSIDYNWDTLSMDKLIEI